MSFTLCHINWTQYLVLGYLSAVLTGFLFGWNLSVLNIPSDYIKCWIQAISDPSGKNQTILNFCETFPDLSATDPSTQNFITSATNLKFAWISSIYCIGGMVGALSGGPISDKLGRRVGIMIICGVYLVSSLVLYISTINGVDSWEVLFFGRILIGLSAGASTTVSTVYLTEIAPSDQESFFGVSFNLGVLTGCLFSQFLGLNYFLGSNDNWPFLFLVELGLAGLALIFIIFGVESPLYLYEIKKDSSGGKKASESLYGPGEIIENRVGRADTGEMKEKESESIISKFRGISDQKNILKTLLRFWIFGGNEKKKLVMQPAYCNFHFFTKYSKSHKNAQQKVVPHKHNLFQ